MAAVCFCQLQNPRDHGMGTGLNKNPRLKNRGLNNLEVPFAGFFDELVLDNHPDDGGDDDYQRQKPGLAEHQKKFRVPSTVSGEWRMDSELF